MFVEVAAGPAGSLRLSLCQSELAPSSLCQPGSLPSPMLQPAPPPPASDIIRLEDPTGAGVQVGRMRLTVDVTQAGGPWSLAVNGSSNNFTNLVSNDRLYTMYASNKSFALDFSAGPNVLYYGSGIDTSDSSQVLLTQTSGSVYVSDSGFRVPYFWASQVGGEEGRRKEGRKDEL